MKLILKTLMTVAGFAALILFAKYVVFVEPEHVTRTGAKVYVTSPTGERLNISQAEATGLSPSHFEFADIANIPESALSITSLANSTMSGETSVLGIAEGEYVLAIDAATLKQRFVVNVTLGEKKIVAIYDPVTAEYYAYDSNFKEYSFTYALTGWKYKGEHILVDEETDSLWHRSRSGLDGVQGELLGKVVYKRDSDIKTLNAWRTEHPESLLIK